MTALQSAKIRERKPSVAVTVPTHPHEHNLFAPKFEDRNQEDTLERERMAQGFGSTGSHISGEPRLFAVLKPWRSALKAERDMVGASVRRGKRLFRSVRRHEQTNIKMAIATCAHHSVQTDSHRPKVAVCDQGIQVGVPRDHEFDVNSFPCRLIPVVEYVALAPCRFLNSAFSSDARAPKALFGAHC